jgi:hypothetical protein
MAVSGRDQFTRIPGKAGNLQGFWSFLQNPCSNPILSQSKLKRAANRVGFEGRSLGSGRCHDFRETELPAFLDSAVSLRRRPEASGEPDLAERGKPGVHWQ